jgi:hypothetical protein
LDFCIHLYNDANVKRLDFGLAGEDLKRRAERLATGHSEVIVLLENRWELRLKEITSRHGGAIASEKLVPAAAFKALDEAFASLST